MKVIDLLNKIANGEEVPNFWWNGCIHEVEKEFGNEKISIFDTYCKKYKDIYLEDLNDEIKFIEEKKIPDKLYKYMEKEEEGCFENILKVYDGAEYEINEDMSFVIDKINEIIDYLKSKGE